MILDFLICIFVLPSFFIWYSLPYTPLRFYFTISNFKFQVFYKTICNGSFGDGDFRAHFCARKSPSPNDPSPNEQEKGAQNMSTLFGIN